MLLFAAAATLARAPKPEPVILVADVGVDDAAGVLWALASPELEVLGIAAAFGCHWDVRVTAQNARRLLSAANRSGVPVLMGSRYQYGGSEPPSADGSFFHGPCGFGSTADGTCTEESRDAAEADRRISGSGGQSAAEFIAARARAQPGAVSVLSFSALTSVAIAIALEPALPRLLKRLVVMGGALYVHGNVSPLAEANFAHDARAARLVAESFGRGDGTERRAEFVLAPLDVTMRSRVTPEQVTRVGETGGAAYMFADACAHYQRAYCEVHGPPFCDGVPLHDAHVVAWLTEPELYTNVSEAPIDVTVARAGDAVHGACVVDRRPGSAARRAQMPRARVLLDVDADAFAASFIERVSGLWRVEERREALRTRTREARARQLAGGGREGDGSCAT